MTKKIMSMLSVLLVMFVLAGCGNNDELESTNDETEAVSESVQEEPVTIKEVLEGDLAPDFTVQTADGSTFVLSEQKGKVVLLNFWATWCGPCVREMPAFEKLHQEYGEEVAILAVNCMEDKDTVDQFISDNGYTFPIAYDVEGEACIKYPSDGIPYTLVIGKDGTVQNIYLGARDADVQYEEYKGGIEPALGKEGKPAEDK